jgi:plastocyanin
MLNRLMLLLALVVVALMAVAGVNAATSKESFSLKGEVYPNYKIEFVNAADKTVKTVKAGTKRIKIEDKSAIHNFHLKGPGVNRSTSVGFIGERIWTVTLKPGKYTYWCDPHSSMMHGSFRVVASS